MTKYVRETAAGKSISAYIIMKGARQIATVQAHFGNGGRVLVNVWHHSGNVEMQHGSASGYGYDKFTAALSGLMIDGHEMTNHCGAYQKPPRGLKYFPSDFKPRKGYRLANGGEYDAETGQRVTSYGLRDAAREELGEAASWEDVDARAKELRQAKNIVRGYGSCYRLEGLKFLEAIGYTVIQAI